MLIQRNFGPLVCYLAEYAHYDLNTNKRHTYKIIKCADKWLSTILGIWLAFSACFEIYYIYAEYETFVQFVSYFLSFGFW